MQWMMAAILICGATVFTSCSKGDNPVNPADILAEKIIGKWMTAEVDGQSELTNEKKVYTFVSTTKAYVSASLNSRPDIATQWNKQVEADVAISGNKMTVTRHPDAHTTAMEEYTVTAINDNEFMSNQKLTVTIDGKVVITDDRTIRFKKVTRDYSEQILGLWECKGLKGGETYNDANARLEFLEDGTYNYWRKNEAGEWESVSGTREFQEYFVDGTLLATRWKNIDEEESREWFEVIIIIRDGKMQWKALRESDDEAHTTFEQIVEWEKVEE